VPIQNTSNNDQVFDNTESLPTAHQNYRTIAQSHVTTYIEQMKVTMQKFQKGSKSIKKGDLVFLQIPNADKNKFDRTKLACKVIQVHENGLCQQIIRRTVIISRDDMNHLIKLVDHHQVINNK